MKKLSIIFAIGMLAGTAAFSQTTTNSTHPKQNRSDANNKRNAAGERQNDNNADQSRGERSTTDTPQKKKNAAGASKSGTPANAGAEDPSSASQAKSAKPVKESANVNISQGAINKTPVDTVVKKGSGSSPRNTRNHTGKTGNYNNEATKSSGKQ